MKPRLRSLPERLQMARRRGVGALRGKPVAHFIHVGKTGGMAMKSALHSVADRGAYTLFVWGHFQTLRRVPSGEKAVFFLRDPLAKFVSAFAYRQRESRPHFRRPWSPEEAEAFSRFSTANELARALSADEPGLRSAAGQAMRDIHQVRDSVFRWFESEDYFLSRLDDVLFIGFQERMAADFEALKRVLGLPSALSLPGPEANVFQKSPDPPEVLDDVASANLRDWYAADIAFYALCQRVMAERPPV